LLEDSIEETLHDETGYAIITVNITSDDNPESRRFDGKRAVIDTGATNSAIDAELITRLGLVQMGVQDSRAFDRVIPDVPFYTGRIEIPKLSWGWNLKSIQPTNGAPGLYDVVIGNDILASCTLTVIGPLTVIEPKNRFTLMHTRP
jgi:hypothetical protein